MAVAVAGRIVRPGSLAEATSVRAERPEARIVGGGTLVVAERSLGLDAPPAYLLLSGIRELQGVSVEGSIGAQTTLRALLDAAVAPMLDVALRSLATPQIRNRATVGGNIAERRPAHTLSPCFLALDATVETAGPAGRRSQSMADFIAEGPRGDEIIVAIALPGRGGFQRYTRVAPRNGPGYAIASVALSIDATDRSVRSGMGGVGSTALAGSSADAFLASAIDWGAGTAPNGAADEYGRLLAQAADPVSDDRASAAYRRHAIAVMGRRLVEAWAEEQNRG